MTIYPELQHFVEKHIDKIESKQFAWLYQELVMNEVDITSRFTELMLSMGVSPLDNLVVIPSEYLAGAPIEGFAVPTHIKTIQSHAFKECMHLKMIDFTGNNSLEKIEPEAFAYCESLKDLNLRHTSIVRVSSALCYFCKKLERVVLPNTVEFIDNLAFYNCNNLLEINIPTSVTYIAKDAFNSSYRVKFVCKKGSYADKYAEEHDIECVYI